MELHRFRKVMQNFIRFRYIEIALILAVAGLFIYSRSPADQIFWKGFGITLAIFALIGLTADYFAEKRGHIYQEGLESFVSKK
ncbi:MAG: hypothetical protein JWM28_687 [Chitinophagaceae bacterium]|nr:hypothetical protein [Chitinophagaceae bacterium]